MPYIQQHKREQLNPAIDELIRVLRDLSLDDPSDNTEGNLNYVFSVILNRLYAGGYKDINSAVGMLQCIALEYYRKHAAPYEDQKAYDNGEVYTSDTEY